MTGYTPAIAVVCGGSSSEALVSRVSGRAVARALRTRFPCVMVLELAAGITEALQAYGIEVVFPVLHGSPGEDGGFQGYLETLGLPYVGSGVRASTCAMDKVLAKTILRAAGLPVAGDAVIVRGATDFDPDRVWQRLGPRVVVKPPAQGSALGMAYAEDPDELAMAVRRSLARDHRVLVEECITGREITAGVLERNGLEVLPVVEIEIPAGAWYDYRHRYGAGLSRHIIPAPLPAWQYLRVQELAARAHRALGCRDLSRADFIVPEGGEPVLLEVNTMPGMTPTSLYPDAARVRGIPLEALAALLIDRALERGGRSALEAPVRIS